MPAFLKTNKKLIARLLIIIFIAAFCISTQTRMMQVKADVVPITVSLGQMGFGHVFPGEQLQRDFTISYSDPSGEEAVYRIIQKIKPLPDAEVPDGYIGQLSQYCQENPSDQTRCYRNLCPYLTKYSDEGEGDDEEEGILDYSDLTDVWNVRLAVPGFLGQVSQDHDGDLVTESGEYGCDISIEVDDSWCDISGYKYNDADMDQAQGPGENGLSGWTINISLPETEELVEEYDVSSSGEIAESNGSMEIGQNYRIEASGTYFAGGNGQQDIEADAKFSQDDYQAANGLPWTDSVHNYESYGPDLLNLKINDVFVEWGDFSAIHTYSYNLPGDGNPLTSQIYDMHYPGNSGYLHIKIYRKISGYSDSMQTREDGFYCFKNLPRPGSYTVSEVMQDGWASTTPSGVILDYQGTEPRNVSFGNIKLE